MKKIIYAFANVVLAILLLSHLTATAQPMNITFKPDNNIGEDVLIASTNGCTPNNLSNAPDYMNWDGYDLNYGYWTIYGLGCTYTNSRTLIRFTDMNSLPSNIFISHAELRLFGVASSGFAPQGNSTYLNSSYDDNIGYVERVLVPWNESNVT